jgi:hypothetical protein
MNKQHEKTAPPLPGRCVEIPQVKAVVSSRDGNAKFEVETHVIPGLDLDGYGSPVMMVPATDSEPSSDAMLWTLYIVRGDCGYDVGTINGLDDPVPLESRTNGFRDFSTVRSAPVPSARMRGNVVSTIYTFDGERYRAGKGQRR